MARTLVMMSAALEMATGAALIANPSFVVHLLIGSALSDGGIADKGGLEDLGFSTRFGVLAEWGGWKRAGHRGTVYLQPVCRILHRHSRGCGRFRWFPIVA